MVRWFILISPGNNFSKTGLSLSNSNSMAAENILGRSLLVYLKIFITCSDPGFRKQGQKGKKNNPPYYQRPSINIVSALGIR